jgi:hypothetical protein
MLAACSLPGDYGKLALVAAWRGTLNRIIMAPVKQNGDEHDLIMRERLEKFKKDRGCRPFTDKSTVKSRVSGAISKPAARPVAGAAVSKKPLLVNSVTVTKKVLQAAPDVILTEVATSKRDWLMKRVLEDPNFSPIPTTQFEYVMAMTPELVRKRRENEPELDVQLTELARQMSGLSESLKSFEAFIRSGDPIISKGQGKPYNAS